MIFPHRVDIESFSHIRSTYVPDWCNLIGSSIEAESFNLWIIYIPPIQREAQLSAKKKAQHLNPASYWKCKNTEFGIINDPLGEIKYWIFEESARYGFAFGSPEVTFSYIESLWKRIQAL